MQTRQTLLHISPHPDDESIGAPCTMLSLLDQGWRVINVAVSLGKVDQRVRRRAELVDACQHAGFDLLIMDPLGNISRQSTPEDRHAIAVDLARLVEQHVPDVVVGPSPSDGHHGHEITGAAMMRAVGMQRRAMRIWQWGLWADLAEPNLFVPVSAEHVARAQHTVAAHDGELERNNYLDLIEARARVAAILGAERVFGWGCGGQPERYAEVLHEEIWDGRGFRTPSSGRRFDASAPLDE